jgi:hypothetical protein
VSVERALREGVAGGFSPSRAAETVFEGIRDERFWLIVAQEEIKEAMRERCRDLMEERNPTTPHVLSLG